MENIEIKVTKLSDITILEDINDDNYFNLKAIAETLKKAKSHDGKPFTIVPLPTPRAIKYKNFRLPASYANFYIGNRAVLVPAFNDPNDAVTEEILKPYFPTKKIILIDASKLIKGQGAIHCITQQQPL